MVESDQLLILAAAMTGIALLSSVFVIAVGARKVREQLLALDALKRSVQTIQSNFVEVVRIGDRTSAGLQELSGVGLHFRQIRREQIRLSDTLIMISSAMETLARLLQLRDDIKREHDGEIRETAEASRSLQDWRSRVSAVFTDVGYLFESESIRELIDEFTAQPTSRPKEGRRPPRNEFARDVGDDSDACGLRASVGEGVAHANDDSRVGSTRA